MDIVGVAMAVVDQHRTRMIPPIYKGIFDLASIRPSR